MRLTANGVEIHYEQAGEAGKNVLLLHGWGCSVKHFEQIYQDLSKDHRVTAMDFPAHGESGRPPEPWGVKDFAACVKDLMGQLGIAPCDIIAHSFGGRVALWLAANEPQTVNRLVITGGAGIRKPQTRSRKRKAKPIKRKRKPCWD